MSTTNNDAPPEHFRGKVVFFGDHIRFFPSQSTVSVHPKLGWPIYRSKPGIRGHPVIRDFEDRAGRGHYDGTMVFLDCSGVAFPTGPEEYGFVPYTLKIHDVYSISATQPKEWQNPK